MKTTIFLATLLFISFFTLSFQAAAECIDRGIDCWCKAALCRNAAYETLMTRQCCETCARVTGAAAGRRRRRRNVSGFDQLFL
uniref:ShKT domain-containing protein n=1 Tax=Panagrolaimus superbus TaxID=310955 RepID=A0A914YI69_9BILA